MLSPRQREVLQHVANGLCVKQAAERAGIQYSTAKTHLQVTYLKLGASGDAHAVAIALRKGLIE